MNNYWINSKYDIISKLTKSIRTITGGKMLTFEEKLAIIESFPELERKDVSLGRVNFRLQRESL